ncbi:hypothetical protein [Parageobacillus thermoglucosidasius]|uniref:hypothetical protein n=1 Tax=Parageobacillus thermoglucosidasius TaxID=1426 RepID=UPI001FCB88B8|nr:hypothetical protein [Parageobacillus thermoglucosidasius]
MPIMLPPISDDDALELRIYLDFAVSQMGQPEAQHCAGCSIFCGKDAKISRMNVGATIRETGELAARGRMMIFRFRLILWLGNMDMDQKEMKCKHCQHLFYKQFSNKYWKCALRQNTNGPATDHRVNWRACGRFLETQ